MKRILIIILTLILSLSNIVLNNVKANSGPTSWEGTSGAEILSIDEDAPIEVLEENLSFDFQEISEENYTVGAWITASYMMHNTSDKDEYSMMTFPMITIDSFEDEDILITVDDESVDYELHPHKISNNNDRLFANIVSDIRADYREDTIFNPNTQGTLWSFELEAPSSNSQEIIIELSFNPSNTQLIVNEFNGISHDHGYVKLSTDLKENQQCSIYYIGDKPTITMSTNATSSEESIAFMDYYENTLLTTIDDKGYNKISLFNELMEQLQTDTFNQSGIVDARELANHFSSELIVSANYGVTFEADQTRTVEVRYKVKASMNKRAYGSREYATYTFEYLLNPAKSWHNFGEISIDVLMDDTKWDLKDTNLNLTKVEEGYSETNKGLPESDIYITLEKHHEDSLENEHDKVNIKDITMMIISLIMFGIAIYAGLILFSKRKKV